MWKIFGKHPETAPRAPAQPSCRGVCGWLVILLFLSLGISGCGGEAFRPATVWYPLIVDFFEYLEEPPAAPGSEQGVAFRRLFTPQGHENFLAFFGGPKAFFRAHSAHHGEKFLWPGHFQTFILGFGKLLAAVEYDKPGRFATATTMVRLKDKDFDLSHARIYRFKFVRSEQSKEWKIDGVEFVRSDPTISNFQPLYIYGVTAFVIFILIVAYFHQLILAVFVALLNGTLNLGNGWLRRVSLSFFSFVLCPLSFFIFARAFAAVAPRTYNSHVGFLLLLLLVSLFLCLAVLRETGDHYLIKARAGVIKRIQDNPIAFMLGVGPRMEFNPEDHRKASITLVLLVLAVTVLGFLPYRSKFTVGATSEKELAFVVENQVEVKEESTLYRIPSLQRRYAVGRAAAGDVFSVLEKVNAEEGTFYRITYGRRSLAYLPARHDREIVRKVEFRLEGDYINYLEDQGAVKALPETVPEDDPEARILAEVYRDKGLEALRRGSLQGLTLAINELNRAIAFDPFYGDPYLHRAYALTAIARFLREDALYNAFGLAGETVANPEKVNVLFYRALRNLEVARQLQADGDAVEAVTAQIALYRGRARDARSRLAEISGQHPYALQLRLETEANPQRAVEVAEKLLRLEPDNIRCLSNYGLLQLRQNLALAGATFAQVVRISPAFLDGRLHLAVVRLAEDPGAGKDQLASLIEEESNFSNKARFYLRIHGVHRAYGRFLPLFIGLWIVGFASLLPRKPVLRHTLAGAAFRTLMMLLMLILISWTTLPHTLPSYGALSEALP